VRPQFIKSIRCDWDVEWDGTAGLTWSATHPTAGDLKSDKREGASAIWRSISAKVERKRTSPFLSIVQIARANTTD
jgi:hypothetical protein